jgi:hypothetical protein
MNANDMLDYVLKQLDGPALAAAEQELASNPEAAARTERLGHAVNRLMDDGAPFAPPRGLAERTSAFVFEKRQPRKRRTILDFAPVRVPFRWADVAVAAGIFLAGVLTLLPAVHRSRELGIQAGCSNNLMQLGRALWLYGNQHDHFPFAPEINAKAPTGAFLAQLHDGGHLTNGELKAIDCPSFIGVEKHVHKDMPAFEKVCDMSREDPTAARHALCTTYAYNVGYFHPDLKRVVPIAADHQAIVPLLADQGPHVNYRSMLTGNSPNHSGRGQNVLYSDLHVGWHNSRRISPRDGDMYLNSNGTLAPGVGAHDTSFLPSLTPALGW